MALLALALALSAPALAQAPAAATGPNHGDAPASAPASATSPTFGNPYAFTEQGGPAIYAAVCAGCHMPDGRGAVGAAAYPALANDPHLAEAGYPIALVLHGQRAMPPFARLLDDAQVAAVVGFIRTSFGNAYAPPPALAEVAAAR